jgi:hypothetical protein
MLKDQPNLYNMLSVEMEHLTYTQKLEIHLEGPMQDWRNLTTLVFFNFVAIIAWSPFLPSSKYCPVVTLFNHLAFHAKQTLTISQPEALLCSISRPRLDAPARDARALAHRFNEVSKSNESE